MPSILSRFGIIKRVLGSSLLIGALVLSACNTNPYTGQKKVNNLGKNAALGAAAGAALGALTGVAQGKNVARNAAIGAGIGTVAGGAVGIYMDQQEKKLRDRLASTGVGITRNGDEIQLVAPGNLLFATNSSQVNAGVYPTLNSITEVLKEYDKTIVEVYGHTDSTGSDAYNQELSQKRAETVASYLIGQGLKPERFAVRGLGESAPAASNDTEQGRAQNRRVEIKLSALQAQ